MGRAKPEGPAAHYRASFGRQRLSERTPPPPDIRVAGAGRIQCNAPRPGPTIQRRSEERRRVIFWRGGEWRPPRGLGAGSGGLPPHPPPLSSFARMATCWIDVARGVPVSAGQDLRLRRSASTRHLCPVCTHPFVLPAPPFVSSSDPLLPS